MHHRHRMWLCAGAFGLLSYVGTAQNTATTGKKEAKTTAAQAKHDNASSEEKPGDQPTGHKEGDKDQTVYSFGLPTPDGKNLPLSEFKGKVLLIVNIGRQSSYAAQLPALEKLNETFKEKGLVVIGVPSNDFGNAEPGSVSDISKYYADAKITFPVMQVSTLTGVHELPLFTYLSKDKALENAGLHWNYTKFLVDRKGRPVVCFSPEIAPDSLDMLATVQEVLDGTWKPKKPAHGRGNEGDDDDGGS